MIHHLDLEFDKIVDGTCEFFKIDKPAILGKSRKRELSDARHMLYKYAHETGVFKCAYISNKIGKRDHSTVSSGIKTLNQLLDNTEILRRIYLEYKIHLQKK